MIWIDVIGIVAVVVTTSSILPQIFKVVKRKRANDLSVVMYIVSMSGQALWIVYGALRKDYQVIAANVVCMSLASTMLILKLVYTRKEQSNESATEA